MTTPRKRRAFVLGCTVGALAVVGPLGVMAERQLHPFERRVKHPAPVTGLSFSGDGGLLLSGSFDAREVHRQDLHNPLDRRFGARASRSVTAEEGLLTADGRLAVLLMRGIDGLAHRSLLDVSAWSETHKLPDVLNLDAFALAPDGQSFAVGYADEIRLYGAPTEDERYTLAATHDRAHGLAFSPDSRMLAVAEESAFEILDRGSGRSVQRFPLQRHHAGRMLNFSPDGGSIFGIERTSVGGPIFLVVWDLATNSIRWGVPTETIDARGTRDGRHVVVQTRDGLELRESATGALIGKASAGASAVTSFALSPDGETAAIGHEDGQIEVESLGAFLARFR